MLDAVVETITVAEQTGVTSIQTHLNRDFRFGHPDTVRVLPSAARMQDLGSPLTVDAPFAPDSVAECRFIAAFQLAGGLFADTAP